MESKMVRDTKGSSREMWVSGSKKTFLKIHDHLLKKYQMEEVGKGEALVTEEQFVILRGGLREIKLDGSIGMRSEELYLLVSGEIKGEHEAGIAELKKATRRGNDYLVPVRVFASTVKEQYPHKKPPTFYIEKYDRGSMISYIVTLEAEGENGMKTMKRVDKEEELIRYLKNEIMRFRHRYHNLPVPDHNVIFSEIVEVRRERKDESERIVNTLDSLLRQ